LKENIIHTDETKLNVLDDKENKNNYMRIYETTKESDHKICLYDYKNYRSKKFSHVLKWIQRLFTNRWLSS